MYFDLLIVEDSTARLKKIVPRCLGYTFDLAFTSELAIEKLKVNTYSYILLDHDLNPEHYEVYDQEALGTGKDVCRYLLDHSCNLKGAIIHSLNPVGAAEMHALCLDAGIKSVKAPHFWDSLSVSEIIKNLECE